MKHIKQVKHDLLTNKYTEVYHEVDFTNNAPHHFTVYTVPDPAKVGKILGRVDFQNGPIKEAGVNGVMNEDLLAMVLTRLNAFQNSPFACKENAVAITKIEEALMSLRERTTDRENKGIEGTHTI